ncbi:hypothetical protein ACQR1W_12725 [Bradyrhizobium sp. HKCCYLS1011]|uniref:hypothetical protein n=1 Tax=Bradyrhizobium sp. HKCCYLS1011 TaxID=3420733 RepID=UPI003EBF47AA
MATGVRVAAVFTAVCLCSCTQVPKNVGPANVRFDQVVKRVKCDLTRAVYSRANQDRTRFGFLTQWAAKVHMTLSVDDQASINPGLAVTDPLAVAGTSFSLGVGGTFTGQAVRSEDYEFFLSFANAGDELGKPAVYYSLYDGCNFEPGVLLESDFDFGSIIDRALSPIDAGFLKKGTQVGPGSSSSPPLPANEVPNIEKALNAAKNSPIIKLTPVEAINKDPRFKGLFGEIDNQPTIKFQSTTPAGQAKEKEDKKQAVADAVANAPKISENVQEVIKNVVEPLYTLAGATDLAKKCYNQMLRDRTVAVASAAAVAISKSNIDNAGPDEFDKIISNYKTLTDARDKVLEKGQAMLNDMTMCKEPAAKPPKPTVLLYDPIDLIQETVNFYITAAGSITPSWKLVRISAPLNSPLLSGTSKNTDTLIITMGRPDLKDGKPVASNAMNTSLQASLISQAINQRLVP